MNIFFSADLHFGHENIIKYCSRPFRSLEHMNTSLIRNWNQRVKEDDVVFHVGDFCFRSGVQGTKIKYALSWEKQLSGKIIHIAGNHDRNNSVRSLIESSILKISKYKVWVQHRPPEKMLEISEKCDFVICGHVHEKWKVKINKQIDTNGSIGKVFVDLESDIDIPIINVGCDVWNFMPIKLDELLGYYEKIKRKINMKCYFTSNIANHLECSQDENSFNDYGFTTKPCSSYPCKKYLEMVSDIEKKRQERKQNEEQNKTNC